MPLTKEQRIANLAKGRATAAANRAARKAQQTSIPGMGTAGTLPNAGPVDVPADGVGEPLEVEVKVGTPAPPRTLKERLLGLGRTQPQPQGTKPTKKPGKKQDVAVMQVLPSLTSLFIMSVARDRFPDEYKPCAPTKAEVDAVIFPLMSIISRRIEVTGQMSQDAIDLANSLTYMMAYSVRAYCTYIEIKHKEQPTHAKQQPVSSPRPGEPELLPAQPAEAALAGGMRAYQDQSAGIAGNSHGGNEPGPGSGSHNGNGAGGELSDQELRDYEAGLVANMFKRDRSGRVGLGLLPG